MRDGQYAGCSARSSSRCTEWLAVRFGRRSCFGFRPGSTDHGISRSRSTGVRFFLNANQVLIGDFPAEMSVLPALLKLLFQEDRPPGIRHKCARGWQQEVAGAILHLHATPEKGGVASHTVPSLVGE